MDSLFGDDDADDFDAIGDIEADVDAAAPPTGEELSPRTNPDLYDHADVERSLLDDFNAGRMPHAFVFAGPAGIGKATLAYRLARFLFAQGDDQQAGLFGEPEKPASLYVAPDHPVARRVASGGHADLLVVEREFDEKKGKLKKNISAEDARGIAPFLRKTAAEGGWRVVLVDGAEDLNNASQNALLKILEEPPPKTVLILTTTKAGAFLPTIRSRCRMVQMSRLQDETVSRLLDRLYPALMNDEKAMLMRIADGSIGKAVQFHEDKGIELYKSLLKIATTMPSLDLVALHDLADKTARGASDETFETVEEIMTGWCDRIVRSRARGTALGDVLPGDSQIFARLTAAYPPAHFMETGEKLHNLFRATIGLNLDKRQALIGAFLMLQNPDYNILNV